MYFDIGKYLDKDNISGDEFYIENLEGNLCKLDTSTFAINPKLAQYKEYKSIHPADLQKLTFLEYFEERPIESPPTWNKSEHPLPPFDSRCTTKKTTQSRWKTSDIIYHQVCCDWCKLCRLSII